MFSGLQVGQGQKPDHARMGGRKLARPQVGKAAKDEVLAGTRVDVDGVTGDAGDQLRFRCHGGNVRITNAAVQFKVESSTWHRLKS